MFNPANFKTSTKPHHVEIIFQGPGVPGKKLPRVAKCKTVLAEDAYLVGYKDKPGCFSVRQLNTDEVDVAFYPTAMPNNITTDDVRDAVFKQYAITPGWGYAAMADLKKEIASMS